MSGKRIIVLSVLLTVIGTWFALGGDRYLDLATLQAQRQTLLTYRDAHPLLASAVYFAAYVATTALSLPGATILTLAGGAVFGLLWAVLLTSFASTLGASGAMLLARYLFRDAVRARFNGFSQAVDHGMQRDGAFYLFTLRLVPIFPFFAVNLVMGLTRITVWRFYWISQLGMLAGTLVYVNAGTQLGRLQSLSGILDPVLVASFALLGVFPLLARKVLRWLQGRRVYRHWPRPARFDRNLVVIGAGAAGLVSAYIAAAAKARVTLIEGVRMGGDCLNSGCVPSKALISSARLVHRARHGDSLGLPATEIRSDFAQVMARVKQAIRDVAPHDSVQRYSRLGVEVIHGQARITSPWSVEVNGRNLNTRAIVIATGARPRVPAIAGLEDTGYLTSDTLWDLQTLPKRLVVIGGGPIGCELSQAFARLGSHVTLVQHSERLLPREDPDVGALLADGFAREGINVLPGYDCLSATRDDVQRYLVVSNDESRHTLECDTILCAVGREARTTGYGLEQLGIPLAATGTIDTDAYLQTLYPNIYACGDVAGPYQFTHSAAHQAWYAAVNALFGDIKRFRADYSVIPQVTFTDPEVARAGLNEQEALAQNIPYQVTRFDLAELDRAIVEARRHGFIKVLTVPGRDKILGVSIVGEHAGELLGEYVLAMRHGLGLNKILRTVHPYPTMAEANKHVAGAWKRANISPRLLDWVERYQRWRLK